MIDKRYCMSSFLMYRTIVNPNYTFSQTSRKLKREFPADYKTVPITTSEELQKHLQNKIIEATSSGNVALALSGGIDSAILAKMMPKGSTAYTFKCVVDGIKTTDETIQAAKYAKECGLKHKIIEITWDDMKKYAPILMKEKGAPIHSIEIQIYMAGLQAKKDGFDGIIYGETADDNFGGLDKILSRDWKVGEFIERYCFVKPWVILKDPKVDFSSFLNFENNGYINLQKFLSEFDIIESINSYINACDVANIELFTPFASAYLNTELDYNRVRSGDSKYLIREIFKRLYPGYEMPAKVPMPRATNEWFKNWGGPTRQEFIENCIEDLTGDQKWMVWALENYLNLID